MGVCDVNFGALLLRQRFCYFVEMRRTASGIILSVLSLLMTGLSLGGCRTEKATKPVETVDSGQTTGVEAPVAMTPNTQSAVADKRPVIVCFGDSLTAGYGTDLGQSYPDYLQTDLNAEGYNYRVVNEGISGNTTKDGVERLDRVIALKPAVVVVEFGGNDGLRGLRIEDSRTNLDKIVGTLKASGTKVVLAGITLPPDYGPDYIKQFTDTYAMLAAKYHVPLLPFLLKGVDRTLPAGTYRVVTDEELIEFRFPSTAGWRR